METTKAEQDREQARTRRKKEAAALALLLLLRRRSRPTWQGSLDATAERIRTQLAPVYLSGILAAQQIGIDRLRVEAAPLGVEPGDLWIRPNPFANHLQAQAAAGWYARSWLREAERIHQTGVPLAKAIDEAEKTSAWRLRASAVTETSRSMGEARRQAMGRVKTDEQMVRVWEASGDKNMCSRCSREHGRWVYLGEPFPLGEPGSVHPRCNCDDQLMPLSWVSFEDRAA